MAFMTMSKTMFISKNYQKLKVGICEKLKSGFEKITLCNIRSNTKQN